MKPRLLDLFCGAGGCSEGYRRAGFHVTGVDIKDQPRYRERFGSFIQADALQYVAEHGREYDAIHASPPCQRYTVLGSVEDLSAYPDLVAPTRAALELSTLDTTGRLYVIENVVGAPLRVDLMLCAAAFGLRSYRHRIFESNAPLAPMPHPRHVVSVNPRGVNRRAHWNRGGFITVTGDVGSYVGPEAMGIDWMTGNELSQAIPPAYTEYIGQQLLQRMRS